MQLQKPIIKYPIFTLSGLVGTVILVILSEVIGFSRANFLPFAGPSYATWVYPIYFLVSFIVAVRFFKLPHRANYYVIAASILVFVWWYAGAEGSLFRNSIPFGIGAI